MDGRLELNFFVTESQIFPQTLPNLAEEFHIERMWHHTEVDSTEFNRFLHELLNGRVNRTCFQSWEVQLLLDLDNCPLRRSARRETLRRYQRAINRRYEQGKAILTLSEYLVARRRRRRKTDSGTNGLPGTASCSSPQ